MLQLTEQGRFAANVMAREDFYFFSRWMFMNRRNYKWQRAPHHRLICDALTRVYQGETKRLIINIPPRYSKTELAVVNFMAWTLGHHPDSEFIYSSYSARLAANFSWQTRELVSHPAYGEVFPAARLKADSKAKDEWRTTEGGTVYAAGAGGSITGYGAGKHRPAFSGAIIIDDPHKADEANSDVIRQGVIDWFQNTLESRKNSPDTPIILIMQRLHEDDLSGWLLHGGNGEEWEHLCLPAIQADGSPLWPQKHSLEELRRMENASPYVFAGQYMQTPAPLSGGIFKPGQITPVDAMPNDVIQWVRGWDLASVTGGDWTAGARLGALRDGRYIIGDMARFREGPDVRDAAIKNTAAGDGAHVRVGLPQDPGQAGKTQILYLTRALSGFSVISSPESGDKITRAEPFAAQVNVGNVLMLKGEWNQALIDEMRMFPNGKYDDQIDALSRAFGMLISKAPPIRFTPQQMRRL